MSLAYTPDAADSDALNRRLADCVERVLAGGAFGPLRDVLTAARAAVKARGRGIDGAPRYAFRRFAEAGRTELFGLLMPFMPTWGERGPLTQAMAARGHPDAVVWLLASKPALRDEDDAGYEHTALRTAVENGHPEVVAVLVGHTDLDFELRDAVRRTRWFMLDAIAPHVAPAQLVSVLTDVPPGEAPVARARVDAACLDGALPEARAARGGTRRM